MARVLASGQATTANPSPGLCAHLSRAQQLLADGHRAQGVHRTTTCIGEGRQQMGAEKMQRHIAARSGRWPSALAALPCCKSWAGCKFVCILSSSEGNVSFSGGAHQHRQGFLPCIVECTHEGGLARANLHSGSRGCPQRPRPVPSRDGCGLPIRTGQAMKRLSVHTIDAVMVLEHPAAEHGRVGMLALVQCQQQRGGDGRAPHHPCT